MAVWLFTLLASLMSAQPAPTWPHERSDIAPSPRVTWGKLENGLRYAILPNQTPARVVSLRLLVLTGSLDERDDERGYAHFVEHMAFNGTRNFPAGELVKFLQRGGAAFGPHVNATTSDTHTLYKIDLLEATPTSIVDGLRVLRDYADGILFEKAEVEKERGVLTNEAASRRSLDADRGAAWRKFLFAGTLVPERPPIGTDGGRKAARPATLRAFYDAGYRPEKMVLVVVGDFAAAEVEASLRTQFASLVARGPARSEPDIGRLASTQPSRAMLYHTMRDGVQIELATVRERTRALDNNVVRLENLRMELARDMVGRRLQRLTESRSGVFNGYSLGLEDVVNRFAVERVIVAGNSNEWSALVGIVEQEVRRAAELGFDPSELKAVAEDKRTAMRQRAAGDPTLASPGLADTLAEHLEEGRVFTFASERLVAGLEKLERITPADCQSAWRATWDESRMRLFVTASPRNLKVPSEKIMAVFEQSRAQPLQAAEAVAETKFAYENFGPVGQTTARTHVAELDVWQVRFANGVHLNLKRTSHERAQFNLRVRFGSGRATEPADRPGLGLWAGGLIAGGLNKHSDEEMRQAMRGHHLSLNMTADDAACELTAEAATEELALVLRVTTAFLTDPAFRPAKEDDVRRMLGGYIAKIQTTPEIAVQRFILPFLAGGSLRSGLPPREAVEKHDFAALGAWLKPMLESAPFEVTIVGDFEIEQAIDVVARTLGALPPRDEEWKGAEIAPLKLPQPPQAQRFSYYAVAGRPTTLQFDWPVREALASAEIRQLSILAFVLEDRLRVQIREEKGATYSPDATFVYSDVHAGLASLRCKLDVQSKFAKRIAEQVAAIAVDLAKQGCSDEEFSRARAQALAGARQQLEKNDYWLDRLDASQKHPLRLAELRTLESDYAGATKAQIDAHARRYLTEKNLFRFFIEPKTMK